MAVMKGQDGKGKPTLSQSIVHAYAMCPERVRRLLERKEQEVPPLVLTRGRAVHAAAAWCWQEVINGKPLAPLNDALMVIAQVFEETVKNEGYYLTPEERGMKPRDAIGKVKDEAIRLGAPLHKEVLPAHKPAAVEHTINLILADAPYDLVGHLDMVTTDACIEELKTSRGKKQSAEFHGSFQLSMYALLFRVKYKRDPYRIDVNNLVATPGGGAYVQSVTTTRTMDDHKATVHRLNQTAKAIQSGIFPPRTSPGMFPCGPQWCSFWDTCPAISPTTRRLIL